MTADLFAAERLAQQEFQPGAFLLHGLAVRADEQWLQELEQVLAQAPLRHMITPGGFRMSVAMSNCGAQGWVTDRRGYRYAAEDPLASRPWPQMPESWRALAQDAALRCGFVGFEPDACLINRYAPAARMTLHQDRNERDMTQPIVSVSLGLPATFLFGGALRTDKPRRVPLEHGDVVVWGGPARLRFHGVLPLKDGQHATFGSQRINLTFRKAL